MTITGSVRFAAALGLLAILASLPIARAQPPILTPGARLRVSAPPANISGSKGTLLHATADSLTIGFYGQPVPVTLPIADISRLHATTGKNRGLGLLRGAGIGLLVGALLGAAAFGDGSGEDCAEYECWVWASMYGGGAGFVVGGIVGVAAAPDRWETVPLGQQRSQSGVVRRPITSVGFSVAF
jgi:hypothetical protein